ncbi:MAG: hypothetical protein IJR55_04330 [Clostridia bacterium]|nr:hypothetical protein [Clostridia bacterium]
MKSGVISRLFSGTEKKKMIWLTAIFILGVLLVIFGFAGKDKTEKNVTTDKEDTQTEEYIALIENKIRNITEQITGDGKAAVIVTVKSGIESVYVCDEKNGANSSEIEYITVRNGDGAGSLVLLKQIYPEIEGVSVACRGGDDVKIQAKLIKAISTALGLSSNRICIIGTK